jgi:Protein of unknown function (DUF3667)
MNCINCNTEITQNYCGNCGQASSLKRIDKHYVQHEVQHILHLEKGIFFTIRELIVRPGPTIHQFINTDRNRLVKPIIFVILASVIYTIIAQFFHIEDKYINVENSGLKYTTAINKWVQNHYGYANLVMGIFIAFFAKKLFKKFNYNYFEIMVVLCYVLGIGMLIFGLFALAEGITNIRSTLTMQVASAISLVYCTWAIAKFFEPTHTKKASYFKAFCAYMLGFICFGIFIGVLGVVLDLQQIMNSVPKK